MKHNQLTINHQDGKQTFRLIKGGYSFYRNRLTISVECENIKFGDDVFPDCALFCFENILVPSGHLRAGQTFSHAGGMNEIAERNNDTTNCHAYFGFHAEEVFIKAKIIEVRNDSIKVRLESRHDDIDYYDSRAKECPTSGIFSLKKKKKSQLWVPI